MRNFTNQNREDFITRGAQEEEKVFLEMMRIIYKLSEYRDYKTYEHTMRVGWLSARLADSLNMDKEFVLALEYAAPLHDIGKIGIPDSIILKPGKLSEQEFEVMKKHTIYGYELLKNSSTHVMKMAAEIALNHHERWNGSGYPRGLKEEQIPVSAQIVGVVDSFDAMVTDRPYKDAVSLEEAFKEIQINSGILYSPRVVEEFLRHKSEVVKYYADIHGVVNNQVLGRR